MKFRNLFLACSFMLSTLFFYSCSKNDSTASTDWIGHLDSSVNASEKAQLRAWIQDGLSASSMEATVKLYDDAGDFYDALLAAKSIYHQRVLINDRVGAIPGISINAFVANGLPRQGISAKPSDPALNLPASEAPNFVQVKDTVLRGGTVLYRVIGGEGSYPTGGYWVLDKPTGYADIIGGTAVQPEWNAFEVIVVYTIAPTDTLKVWKGMAARQPIAGTTNKYYDPYLQQYHLDGGVEQIYIPVVYRDFRNEETYNHFLSNITSQDSITWAKK